MVSGFTLEKLELHVMPPFGFLFGKRLDTIFHVIGFDNIGIHRPHNIDLVSNFFMFLIFTLECEYPYSLPNSPDACGRKPYPERKSWGYKSIRLRVDKASASEVV